MVSLTSGVAFTNELWAGVGEAKAAVWLITPVENSADIKFSIDCTGFSASAVEEGYSLRIPGQVSSAKAGTPDIPHLAKLLPGVKGARAVLTVQGFDPTNFACTVVAAVGHRLDDSNPLIRKLRPFREPDPAVYEKDGFWPFELGTLAEASIGTQKVMRVECYPVQYNPVSKGGRFYRRLEGVLRFERKEPIPSS